MIKIVNPPQLCQTALVRIVTTGFGGFEDTKDVNLIAHGDSKGDMVRYYKDRRMRLNFNGPLFNVRQPRP